MNRQDILELLRQYHFEELEVFSFQKFGAGLIHQTFFIEIGKREFILQGFNSNVFKHPDRIEKNLSVLSKSGDLTQLPFQIPLPILNRKGTGMVEFQGKLYRLFDFVEGKTLQQINDLSQAKKAAEAYALFSKWADSFSLNQFEETIPNFHRLDLRFQRLEEVAKSAKNLNPEEQEILDFYINQNELVKEYLQITAQIPERLTHNDTKINNLIFSSDLAKVAAVIDLDTIMPGYLLYDFGDLVRTVASAEEETSQAWENQKVVLSVFEKLLEGYWAGAADLITKIEAESLLIGGEVMTCLMGVRFFTDHLEGNVYYNVDYQEQNLHRAKNQMILLKSLQANRGEIKKVFSEITGIQIDS
ncbi:phosphotransferase enzyme family protein [Algoriphagus marinus]|uniref:phosphotransferase enzyme family protein n=1 Tax=Algoriphagus marinus TaxID=1925762 RepID=UPI00094B8323|nr:aminoglycoside phosphotransferase family protein [Algoriphagus marinus]